jgi:hypothetical protein
MVRAVLLKVFVVHQRLVNLEVQNVMEIILFIAGLTRSRVVMVGALNVYVLMDVIRQPAAVTNVKKIATVRSVDLMDVVEAAVIVRMGASVLNRVNVCILFVEME